MSIASLVSGTSPVGIVADIIGGLVCVGMEAYAAAQVDEAKALALLDSALAASRLRVANALETLDAARREADAKIDGAYPAGDGK